MLKLCKINACSDGILGLHLSRAPWDPYPWVSDIQDTSCAYQGGVRGGDTILEVNGFDIIGQKISELATIIRVHWTSGASEIQFLVWRHKTEQNTPNQQSLQKFATCLQNIAQLLECPICLEVVKPPGWQCCNGHVLCNSCRARTTKCSICRATLGPKGRCLLSDKLFTLLAETFPCNAKNQKREATVKGQKTFTPRPIAAIKYIKRKSKQIVTIKVSSEALQEKNSPDGATAVRKSYHCPTGKSCVNPSSTNDPSKLSSQWDVLTHLRRVHQLAVTQHYGTYGERIEVQLMNKSISCISLEPNGLHPPTTISPNASAISSSKATPAATLLSQSGDMKISSVASGTLVLDQVLVADAGNNYQIQERGVLSNRRTTDALDEVCRVNRRDTDSNEISDGELFFIARIPLCTTSDDARIDENDGNVAGGNERCAIFIWYCGDEKNVKKFQAVIECKRSHAKWKGFVHPLTRTWESIRCQKEFLELQFDVSSFFDLVIKLK